MYDEYADFGSLPTIGMISISFENGILALVSGRCRPVQSALVEMECALPEGRWGRVAQLTASTFAMGGRYSPWRRYFAGFVY